MPAGGIREVFVRLAKGPERTESHDALSALLDAVAMCMSKALTAGVPLVWFIRMFRNTKFAPAGRTNLVTANGRPFSATSPLDALAWILEAYLPLEEREPEPAVSHRPVVTDGVVGAACGDITATKYEVGGAECLKCAAPEVYVRCLGDGENGCGHDRHEGPCQSNHASMHPCKCRGSRT